MGLDIDLVQAYILLQFAADLLNRKNVINRLYPKTLTA